jgi:sortase (surface protein transpeptidase)
MIATGLLLSIAAMVASAQPWTAVPHTVTGQGRPHPQPAPVAKKAAPAPAQKPDQPVADPVRLRIPAIGVDAPIDPLTVDRNGVLPPPATDNRTGWWRDGPEPGERGPAVIVGHVDSYEGPAVFIRLTDLRGGDQILVDRADGSTAVFATQRVEQHAKDGFPTQAVYGRTPDPQLRLITCGGEFEEQGRRYLDNVVVYADRSG